MSLDKRHIVEVHRREPLNHADPPIQPVSGDASAAWILNSFAFVSVFGEVGTLVQSVHSERHGTILIWFSLFVLFTIGASLFGLFARRAAWLSGSKSARGFATILLAGVALGLCGMLAMIFCGAM